MLSCAHDLEATFVAHLESIAQRIRQASDILVDGSHVEGRVCDGISIGIGFEADRVGPVTRVVADPPPSPKSCP